MKRRSLSFLLVCCMILTFLPTSVFADETSTFDAETVELIATQEEETLRSRFDAITNEFVPCIIMTNENEVPALLKEIAMYKNFPILKTNEPTYRVMVNIASYLDEQLAQSDSVHGILMSIYGCGVLFTGKSGIGKSELALDLVSRGHILVADDRVDCYRIHNKIHGEAPEVLQKYLEIRGVGIVDVVQLYGARAFMPRSEIDYVIHLKHFHEDEEIDRLGSEDKTKELIGVEIPMTTLPVSEGRNLSVMVEAAVRTFLLKGMGINTTQEFREGIVYGDK